MMHEALYIKSTADKGWGVFCHQAINANVTIEISPVVLLSKKDKILIDQTPLFNYIFYWQNEKACMSLGYISIYNHSYSSNCEYFQDYENNTVFIKTVRKIAAHEELCINYNGDWDNKEKVWFEVI
jgi:SET domain-containing protein